MFTIQLFSLHMEFSIRKVETKKKRLEQLLRAQEIEQDIEAFKVKHIPYLRFI